MKTAHTSNMVMAASLLFSHVNARSFIQPRDTKEIISQLLQIFRDSGAFPEDVDAWEYTKDDRLCEVYMESTNGAKCYATVTCNDGKREYNSGFQDWNACFKGGRQYFTDPRIGDFSITFTNTNDMTGEGLTGPILQLKNIGDWREIDATSLAFDRSQDIDCASRNGINCNHDPDICTWLSPSPDQTKGRTRKWMCGVPKIGKEFGDELDSNKPTGDKGYADGWCGVHVTHYQKPNPSKDPYALEAKVFDSNNNEIGNSGGKHDAKLVFNSKLPLPFVVSGGNVDKDPVYFEYNNVRWDSNDASHCKVGKYDSGKREMDCGFSC